MKSPLEFIDLISRERTVAIMGVVNVTPDSFFDGGRLADRGAAERHIDRLLDTGADIIDIGAESTRPGADPIGADEQISRATPSIEHAVRRGAWVSIDTTLPEVAAHALGLGARLVNDVSCLQNSELARVVAQHDAALLLMHSRGSMTSMPGFGAYADDGYDDVVLDVTAEWSASRERAMAEGVPKEHVWFDPGLGFHKSAEHSLEALRRLGEFRSLGAPICLGPSRKSFIGSLDGSGPEERLGGTIAACLHAVRSGARILRVHDPREVRQAVAMERALHSDQLDLGVSARYPSSSRMRHDA